VTSVDHNQVFTTDQKRSIVNNFVQNKWSPNVGSAWDRPQKKSDFALQILSRRSNSNNAVSREDFLKQLIKIEGLNEGHFTTDHSVEELVAPVAGLIAVEEARMSPQEDEEQEADERAWEGIWEIEDDDSVRTEANDHGDDGDGAEANDHGKDFPAVGNELVKEHRDNDLEITFLYDQINKGGLIGLISSIPLKTLYLGIMFVFGMVICLVITAHKLRKGLFYHPAIEELVDFKSPSGHHKKYP